MRLSAWLAFAILLLGGQASAQQITSNPPCSISLNGCTGSINANGHTIGFPAGNFATAGTGGLTITLSGTTSITFPAVTDTLALLGQNNSFTGYQTVITTVTPNQTAIGVDWAGYFDAKSPTSGADSLYFDFGLIGRYDDINTSALTGAAHRAGGLSWYIGGATANGQPNGTPSITIGTRPLVIGHESKAEFYTGAYGVGQAHECNLTTIGTAITYTELDGCAVNIAAAYAGGGSGSSTIAAYPASFVGPIAGVTLPFYVNTYFKVPTGTGTQGNITTTIDQYFPSWAGYAGYANLGVVYLTLNQESKAVFQTAGQMFSSFGTAAEIGPVNNAGMVSGRYYYGVHPVGAPSAQNLPISSLNIAPVGVFYSPARKTFTKISLVITTAVATSNVEFAVYNISAGTLTTVVCSGTVSSAATSTTAAPTEATGLSCPLQAGPYAVVLNSSGATAVGVDFMQDSGHREVFGDSGLGSLTTFYLTKTYGTAWPSNPTLNNSTGLYANQNPLVGFRF